MRIEFKNLIGNKYPIEVKMNVLDWMLRTGRGFDHQYGWNRDGINKSLFDYSANSYDCDFTLGSTGRLNWYFDAIFSRAIYAPENRPLKEWREKENIYPNKYRMLRFKNQKPINRKHTNISCVISDIQSFEGKMLKKEFHQPQYYERTDPKIIGISIYTIGKGWQVVYSFSFKECDYEMGWQKSYRQKEDESIWVFLDRVYCELNLSIEI